MKNLFLVIGLLCLAACLYGTIAKNIDTASTISSGLFASIFLFGYYQKKQGKEMFEE